MSAAALLLALALQSDAAPPPATSLRVEVGGQLGFPHVYGVLGRGTVQVDGRPRFDVDVLWEPSVLLQSYSLGAAWRPLDGPVALGTRLRLLQFQAPWARDFDWRFNHLGLGLEAGLRLPLGEARRVVLNLTLQATWVPTTVGNLTLLWGLHAGISYGLFERAL